jgi:hypothetical protein
MEAMLRGCALMKYLLAGLKEVTLPRYVGAEPTSFLTTSQNLWPPYDSPLSSISH